jgi:septal ring factor EnvC (AmiA/AmiB activator)
MDHATASMQKTFEELNVGLRSVATQGVAKINKSIEISFEENQRFSDTLRELNETTKKLNDSIKDIMNTFSPVKELEINATGLNNSINKTATIIENMSANLSQLDDIQPNIKMFVSSISEINKATSGLSTALNNHKIVISEIESLSNSQLEIVNKHQKEIEETMKKSRDNLGLLNDGLMQSVQFITDELGRKSSGG